jgi:amino acid permease
LFANIAAVVGTIALPLCCAVLIAFICLVWKRQPLKLWSVAAPVALVVLLVYCGVLVPAVRREAKANYMMDQMIDRTRIIEGAYMAQQLGQTWPK